MKNFLIHSISFLVMFLISCASPQNSDLPPLTTNPKRLDAYTSLNDDKDPLYGTDDDLYIIENTRAINAWQFTLTAMIGI